MYPSGDTSVCERSKHRLVLLCPEVEIVKLDSLRVYESGSLMIEQSKQSA